MALSKIVNTVFGVSANYHKIQKIEIDSGTKEIVIRVGIYASEEAKNSGASPLWNEYITLPFNELEWDPREIFYPLLKEYIQSYLQGATDTIDTSTVHQPVFELVPAAKTREL